MATLAQLQAQVANDQLLLLGYMDQARAQSATAGALNPPNAAAVASAQNLVSNMQFYIDSQAYDLAQINLSSTNTASKAQPFATDSGSFVALAQNAVSAGQAILTTVSSSVTLGTVQVSNIQDRPSEAEMTELFLYGFFTYMAFGVILHMLHMGKRATHDICD